MQPRPHWFLLLLTLAGCVVPVGPEWVDPQENVPPFLVSANPPVGSALASGSDGGLPSVEVVLGDQNSGDKLEVKWIIDSPPFVEGVSRLALFQRPLTGSEHRAAIRFAPTCSDVAHPSDTHRLLLAVSDREFADDSGGNLDTNGYLLESSWTFTLQCQ